MLLQIYLTMLVVKRLDIKSNDTATRPYRSILNALIVRRLNNNRQGLCRSN